MNLTPEQEKRFFKSFFDSFSGIDEKGQSAGRQFQKNIINNFNLENPNLNLEVVKIEDTYNTLIKISETFGNKFSFMELFENMLESLSVQDIGSIPNEQIKEIKDKYTELKQKFLLWEAEENINNF